VRSKKYKGRPLPSGPVNWVQRYINSAEFKQRYATVLARQAAGEHITPEQIGKVLRVSPWIAEIAIRYAAKKDRNE
jgi:hypothetical protein